MFCGFCSTTLEETALNAVWKGSGQLLPLIQIFPTGHVADQLYNPSLYINISIWKVEFRCVHRCTLPPFAGPSD